MMNKMDEKIIRAINASLLAGKKILDIYSMEFEVEFKKDESPLTRADKEADEIIKSLLGNDIPILSEEGKNIPYEIRKDWDQFWLVDPLDGTKEFIKKNGEFTVNIALIENQTPKLGIVYVPVTNTLYLGEEKLGSYKIENVNSPITDLNSLLKDAINLQETALPGKYTIVASRSHLTPETETFINEKRLKYGIVELVSKGSSLKLCLVAEGLANAYPRLAPTMEWDTAAAHAVAKFANCKVIDYNTKTEMVYNKENLLNPHFLVHK